ncbi:GNAT family N-acetyltransferase [Paracoccus sp. Ld10]|uniref:GNAT family N-acetyltransferase n=1 Tax=Paracoccus sp. Ld10 TaxID=649158 RepID=UPI00386C4051
MDCACGHTHTAAPDLSGTPVPVARAPMALHGHLICHDTAQMLTALDLLEDHATASRAEPGCLRFDIAQSDDPMVWTLTEVFADEDAFAAHQARTAMSLWGVRSRDLGRDFHRHPAQVMIRPEVPSDHAALDALLTLVFGGPSEARLLRTLRTDGDLSHSLVAHVEGVPVGHIALSPLQAVAPAFALAPLAVHPAMRRRGIGRALIDAALRAAGAPVVVLGDPAVYAGSGFVPADLLSPYAGPGLQIHGTLPPGSVVAHAAAFAAL